MCKAKRGGFKDLPPEGMLHFAMKGLVERTKIDPKEIHDVCIGNCL
jgi:acetyl-CoA acetyltransferase